ncbi:MAG: ribosomal protein S18-alanine N-acetyltransferase [Candidatus Dormiibacterota bacterium]
MILISQRLRLEPMQVADIPEVRAIELDVFPTPWPGNAYHRELTGNRSAHYLCLFSDGQVSAYGGLWAVGEEAHVTTIGVRRSEQGKGLGKVMFAALVNRAYWLSTNFVSLEVRPSNDVAIHLYETFGFKILGRRRGYYTDNGEDALVMWSDLIHAPAFKARFLRLAEALQVDGFGALPDPGWPGS